MGEDAVATERDLAELRVEITALTEAVRQVVGTLQAQGDLLSALLQAVIAPEAGDASLAEVLARIADSLELQGQDLTAIRVGLADRLGGSRAADPAT